MQEANDFTAHLTLGAVAVYGIQWLKASSWFPWISMETDRMNRLANILTAFIASVGIGMTYDAVTGTLILTGLTASSVGLGAWEMAKQVCVQRILYDGVVKKVKVLSAGAAEVHP